MTAEADSALSHSATSQTHIKPEPVQDEDQKSWQSDQQVNGHNDVNGDCDTGTGHPDAPPFKRQKLAEGGTNHRSSPRTVSPPWKSVQADGPTTFLENGKRRSGRTNAIPLEQQPQSAKRQTRAAYGKASEKNAKPLYNTNKHKTKTESLRHAKTPSIDPNNATRKASAAARPPSRSAVASPAVMKEVGKKSTVKTTFKKEPPSPKRKSSRIPTKSKREELEQDELQMDESLQGTDSDSSDQFSHPSSPPLLLKKVSFIVSMPKPTVNTPANIPPPRQYLSFKDFIDKDQTEEAGVRLPMTTEQIQKEATKRLAVLRANKPGRVTRYDLPSKQPEPRQYSHHDHLLAHMRHLRILLKKEYLEHRSNARTLALEAKKYVESRQANSRVKTAEELEKEKMLAWKYNFKTVAKDLDRLWQAVEVEVNAARQLQYDQEQQEIYKSHLNRVLDRTEAKMIPQSTESLESDVNETDLDGDSEMETGSSESENSEQMSASDSDSDELIEADMDHDADMTLDELKAKYDSIPEIEPEKSASEGDNDFDSDVEDESDPETIMDSEMDSEDDSEVDEGTDDSDSEDEGVSDEDNGGNGLLSLFSEKEIEEMGPASAQQVDEAGPEDHPMDAEEAASLEDPEAVRAADMAEVEAEDTAIHRNSSAPEKPDELRSVPDSSTSRVELMDKSSPALLLHDTDDSREHSDHHSPGTSSTKVTEAESVSSVERQESQLPQLLEESRSKYITPVPPLLRGTLREYQHEGLDWLANLYAGGRSGILADEMGLGKTIQSIALLAHLATTYEVWGPHLIVVPTSVMLNWEMEFKKFLPSFKILTYYGDIKERKQKRRGWLAEDSFNVLITSYQLVLQDASSFKRRKWHYMILDEAHNIKNFRSERWQTMMTFNTRARLLLTGTPLQNNLTELWSLLFFLHYGQESEGDDDAFAGLREWSEWFKKPVESILEHGKQVLDQEDQEQVAKLHKVIRPFLLRRLKANVEKQMPLKYEHVELCRLSKRQRQLYDGFMSRAQTKETLASGNYLSIINALMQLRKVCNHPDLFETRPINTSFAMSRSVAADFEIHDLLVRKKLCNGDAFDHADLDFLELVPISRENMSKRQLIDISRWNAYQPLKDLRDQQWLRVRNGSKIFATANRAEVMSSLESVARQARLQNIERTMYYDAYKHHQHPVYGVDLFNKFSLPMKHKDLSGSSLRHTQARFWDRESICHNVDLVRSLETRSHDLHPFIEQYACVTPAAVATDMPVTVIGESRVDTVRNHQALQTFDPFHQARMKLSIAFPDKRLLQYDCGKLQRLDKLLRRLESGGHRALIFTQMTKVLDILEQFLNIHGHRYLRLDGSTKVEQRQILTDRFNNDTRILCFILSSRSGGLGINLTGADTVIFYDLDWNPAMDKQCTDRAHRIGQTRDVHIYRFVSEHTIESNILRKANQKQLLDDVVIQEGNFDTKHLTTINQKGMLLDDNLDEDDAAGQAFDRVLGGGNKAAILAQAEDRDDVAAAQVAEKEVENADDGDFDDQAKPTELSNSKEHALDSYTATDAALAAIDKDGGIRHIDDYMLGLQRFLLKDIPLVIKDRDRSKRSKNRKRDDRRRR